MSDLNGLTHDSTVDEAFRYYLENTSMSPEQVFVAMVTGMSAYPSQLPEYVRELVEVYETYKSERER